ncbi:antibiotic biosynthesis monooxygenase [Dyadobacter fanqingshengii]|uniref:Antibiotic biosynthesis monooxygenase n=1 Tax=Dyadobacter fanqingshengii TaxID=2906443 RepID=A0A9X1T826_9BACT|nr:antibiotic biosynthesis monooxygenase family protein [Dyadobacter fanqingshengii]MCF0039725.1 antibiotic biosynthesis monooxygenase [Dyadobacter fanqingshengii]USJ38512.1 antibiotic biosynthesis monooxygenase [Dyadobacter fanqingshengii]
MKTTGIFSITKMPVVLSIAMFFCMINMGLVAQDLKGATVAESIAKQSETVARLTRYEVKRQHRAAFRKMAKKYVSHSLRQKGNILSEAYYEEENPSVMWIVERWENRNKFEENSKRPPFRIIESMSGKVLVQPAKVIYAKDLEPLSKRQWRTVARKNDKPITIMLFVDARAGTEDNFKKVYHTAMPQFRSEPGVVTYQLSQLEEDSTQFVTYEKFRGEDAFQYHLKFPPIQPVIDYLETSIKKQPFQTGIHRLIEFAPGTRE